MKFNFLSSILSVGVVLLVQSCATTTTTIQGNLPDYKPVMGDWIRTGGYRLLIKEADGKVKVRYINPSQGNINVSQSKISTEDKKIKIEVTLLDVNYPGSHYVLMHDEKTDTLIGKYTYPRGTVDVTFVRDASTATRPTTSIPLPQDMKIVPPNPNLPPDIKSFSGKWFGVWDGILQHVLVVEYISPPNVTAIYAHGSAPSWNIYSPSFSRVQGEIEPGTLKLTLRRPATVTYRIQPDGTLDATYESEGGMARAKMKRIDQ